MVKFLQDYFHYTKRERQGALVLIGLIIVFFLAPKLLSYYRAKNVQPLNVHFIPLDTLEQWMQGNSAVVSLTSAPPVPGPVDPNIASKEALTGIGFPNGLAERLIKFRTKGGRFHKPEDLMKLYGMDSTLYLKIESFIEIKNQPRKKAAPVHVAASVDEPAPLENPLFEFDPNTASLEDWITLGVPNRIAARILKYREKGGQFREPEDLMKIYDFPAATYRQLSPYIRISNPGAESNAVTLSKTTHAAPATAPFPTNKFAAAVSTRYSPVRIDVNQSAQEDWERLYGIGPGYAKKILNFRDKLGGFISLDQVGETSGLPDSTFQRTLPQLDLSAIFRKLDINKASLEVLVNHPYLNKRQAHAIVNYREAHGPFIDMKALSRCQALDENTLRKLSPYLDFGL